MFTDLSALQLLTILISIIVSLSAHEAMHAYVSHLLGDSTAHDEGRLTLNPLKHIDFLTTVLLPFGLILFGFPPFFIAKPVPFNPSQVRHGEYGVALVGLAGPFTNLALAAVTAIGLHVFNVAVGTTAYTIMVLFMQINVGFFVFNMIPIPPLDGSRLLYAFAPDWLRDIMMRIEAMGFMMLLFVMLLLFPLFLSGVIANIASSIMMFLLQF